MILTKTEAVAILSRVFATEIAGSKIEIEDVPLSNRPAAVGDVVISAYTFDRVFRAMVGVPNLKIESIRFYREVNPGVGLAEAKDYVEKLVRGGV
jgi:ribosomal protein L7/L12